MFVLWVVGVFRFAVIVGFAGVCSLRCLAVWVASLFECRLFIDFSVCGV